jgi:dinuclear metal center YbgI/SA1388 family protein
MQVTVLDIIQLMNEIAPPGMAEDWDNVGLQIGEQNWPVKKIWVSLDPLLDVMEKGCQAGVDLIITHHPLIFRPIKAIDFSNQLGNIIELSLQYHTAIFSAHTNLDSVQGGINDFLAEKLALKNLTVLDGTRDHSGSSPSWGLGRVGELETSVTLDRFVKNIKDRLGLDWMKVSGDPGLQIQKVAVCTGSGSGLMKFFLASPAQVYVSGDLHYHDARDAEQANRALIDIGHFSSEHFVVDMLSDRLERAFRQRGFDVSVVPCLLEKDPFRLC